MTEANLIPDVAATPFRRLMDLTATPVRDFDEAFRGGRAAVPTGTTTGIALTWPGSPLCRPLARFYALFWRGKVFADDGTRMVNRVLPFDARAIDASVAAGTSATDGLPCTILDYSGHWFGRRAHDEIREIEPGVYLGQMLIAGRRVIRFGLVEHQPL